MSVGIFLGIKPSFLPESESDTEKFIVEINRKLHAAGAHPYLEPDVYPNPYIDSRFGRSSLDHNSAEAIGALAEYCGDGECANLNVLTANPYRVTFLPLVLLEPVKTDYTERIGGELTQIWAGSLAALILELRSVAREIGIPLEDGILSDEIAGRINDYETLSEDDSGDPDLRMAWLMVHEGCRLATSYEIALSFAG